MSFARPPTAGPSNLRRSTRATTTSTARGSIPLPRATPSTATAATGPTTTAGVKRRTRSTSVDPEKELNTAKRPALAAYSSHINATSLQRQLLEAQGKVTELQNQLLEKQGDVDRLEADRRLLAVSEEKERVRREELEKELTAEKDTNTETISSLQRRLSELEQDHDDLLEKYDELTYESTRTINALRAELGMKERETEVLKEQLSTAETQWDLAEKKIAALESRDPEDFLDDITQALIAVSDDGEGGNEDDEDVGGEIEKSPGVHDEDADGEYDEDEEDTSPGDEDMSFTAPIPSSTPARPRQSRSDHSTPSDLVMSSPPAAREGQARVRDISSPPAAREDEENRNYEGGRDSQAREGSGAGSYDDNDNVFKEGPSMSSPPFEAYPDPGAPPPYAASESSPSARSDSIASEEPEPAHGMPVRKARAHRGGLAQRAQSRSPSVVSATRSATTTPKRRQSAGASASIIATLRATVERLTAELEKAKEREKHYDSIREQLASLTSHITSLEAAKARLTADLQRTKQRADGTELLREEKRELERRVLGVDDMRRRCAELEAKVEDLERENSKLSKVEAGSTPSVSVARELVNIRQQYASLLEQHGTLRAEHAALSAELSSCRGDFDDLKEELSRSEKSKEVLLEEKIRLESERKLDEREKDYLKSLVASYEEEVSSLNPDPDASFSSNVTASKQRVGQLETLLDGYKSALSKRDSEVEQMSRIIQNIEQKGAWRGRSKEDWQELEDKNAALREALQVAEQTASKQEIKIDGLEQRLFELNGEIGAGRHVPPGIRVLCLRDNPAQRWVDTRTEVFDRLKNENRALLDRVETLENQVSVSGASSQDPSNREHFVPRESYDALVQSNEELVEAAAQKDKRILRLQQIYTAKSQEFREAIEAILGIKLAFYPNGQVRVTSRYDLSAAFVFKPSGPKKNGSGDDMKMQLIAAGEEATPEIQDMMQYWIQREMCIPCFMASVTIECYEKVRKERERGMQVE